MEIVSRNRILWIPEILYMLQDYTLEPNFHFFFKIQLLSHKQILRNTKEMLYFLYVFNTMAHFAKVLLFCLVQSPLFPSLLFQLTHLFFFHCVLILFCTPFFLLHHCSFPVYLEITNLHFLFSYSIFWSMFEQDTYHPISNYSEVCTYRKQIALYYDTKKDRFF